MFCSFRSLAKANRLTGALQQVVFWAAPSFNRINADSKRSIEFIVTSRNVGVAGIAEEGVLLPTPLSFHNLFLV